MDNIRLYTFILLLLTLFDEVSLVHAARPPVGPPSSSVRQLFIQTGDTLSSLLKRHGFEPPQINQVLTLRPRLSHLLMVPQKPYLELRNLAEQKTELRLYDWDHNQVIVFIRQSNQVNAKLLPMADLEKKSISIRGEVNGSLISSVFRHRSDMNLVHRLMDAYAYDFNLPQTLQRGAMFAMRFTELRDHGFPLGTSEVEWTAIEVNDQIAHRRFIPTGRSEGVFVDPREPLSPARLYSPVRYQRITSGFKKRRFHPIKKRFQAHLGIDFELPAGAAVLNVAPGRVLRVGRNRAAGNYAVIAHEGLGVTSFYNHLRVLNAQLKVNQRIKAGYKLGEIGCTGYCTRPHLHFAIKKNSEFIDPLPWLKPYTRDQEVIIKKQCIEKSCLLKSALASLAPNAN